MSRSETRMNELRIRRARILQDQKQRELRASYGAKLAAIVSEATGIPVSLDRFDPGQDEPYVLHWPKQIGDSAGLVAQHVSKTMAVELLSCFDTSLGRVNGKIGFHDKNYLGIAELPGVSVDTLVTVSECAEDSVILYLPDQGAILVDYYKAPPDEPFSIVVQGDALVRELAGCFRRCKQCGH